jgi:peroxiredoxin
VEPELSELGFQVIAISADQPSQLVDSLDISEPGYSLYSDSELAAARAFGIVFQLTDAEVAGYAKYGIDLEAASGQSHHQLPVPSVFLVDATGTIQWVYSNPDYEVRPENADLLREARRVAGGSEETGP